MSHAELTLRTTLSTRHTTIFAMGSAGLITLCVGLFLVTSVATAFAQESEQGTKVPVVVSSAPEATTSTFDAATLPSLDTIDAQTNITVFLRSGVPAELRLVALRRAWSADPAIRDYLDPAREYAWDFTDPNAMAGFGELGPDVDIKNMLAQIISEPPALAVSAEPSRLRYIAFSLAAWASTSLFNVAHN